MEAETALAGDEADAADFGAGRAGRSELAAVVGMASVLFKRLSNLKATRVPWASIAIVHRFIRFRAWVQQLRCYFFKLLTPRILRQIYILYIHTSGQPLRTTLVFITHIEH